MATLQKGGVKVLRFSSYQQGYLNEFQIIITGLQVKRRLTINVSRKESITVPRMPQMAKMVQL